MLQKTHIQKLRDAAQEADALWETMRKMELVIGYAKKTTIGFTYVGTDLGQVDIPGMELMNYLIQRSWEIRLKEIEQRLQQLEGEFFSKVSEPEDDTPTIRELPLDEVSFTEDDPEGSGIVARFKNWFAAGSTKEIALQNLIEGFKHGKG